MPTDIDQAISLTTDILAQAKADDLKFKAKCAESHQFKKSVGDSYYVYYLTVLKEKLEKIKADGCSL